jgi:hypothetical protein
MFCGVTSIISSSEKKLINNGNMKNKNKKIKKIIIKK